MHTPTLTRLYLVRHCEVENPRGLLYGHLPNFPLSSRGIRQAQALGGKLANSGARRIYTSPLERAQQTAAIIHRQLPASEVVTTSNLVEAEFGRYLQGISLRQIPWRRPLWWLHMVWPGLLPNDETVSAMAARVDVPLQRHLTEFPGESCICVSHGDPIQAFWIRHRGRRRWALHRLQCAKGAMLCLDYRGTHLTAVRYIPPTEVTVAEIAPGLDARTA